MVTAAAAVAATVGFVLPANATSFNGACEGGEVCLWYNSNYGGPVFDDYNDLGNYSGWYFVNSSYGLNDNSASSANYDGTNHCYAYMHAGGGQPSIVMLPYGQAWGGSSWAYSDLGWADNQLSSHYFR
jgi:hypothetical protein